MWETQVRSLGWEDPLEKEMATHSSILAWRIPWTEEPGRLQSTGSQRVRHNWATSLSLSLSVSISGRETSTILQWLTHSPGTWTRCLQHICIKLWLFVYFPQSQTRLRDWAHTTSSLYTGPLKDRDPHLIHLCMYHTYSISLLWVLKWLPLWLSW